MEALIVYEDIKDREFLDSTELKLPIFIKYIDILKDKKEAYALKSHWGARKNPFVVLTDNNGELIKVFYSETKGDNALIQLINFLK